MPTNATSPHDNRTAINALLDDFLKRQINASETISPFYQDLWNDIARLMHSGGKRLRPQIALLSYEMFGGQDTPTILPAATALELLHLGTLVHDDIIDRDSIRYGVANISGSYNDVYLPLIPDDTNRSHYANSAALLAGDLLISSAYLLMAESSVEPKYILQIQRLLGRGIFEVIGGELIDTESAFRSAGSIPSETIAFYKTSSYSFTLPLLVGATLAGLSTTQHDLIRTLGKNLGIAYQLCDDILGVFGDEETTGKSSSGDIREGKRTYMVEQFYTVAKENQVAIFERYFGNPNISASEVATVRELLVSSGALQRTEEMIHTYEQESREVLGLLNIDPVFEERLDSLVGMTTKRVK